MADFKNISDWRDEVKNIQASAEYNEVSKEINNLQRSGLQLPKLPKSEVLEIVSLCMKNSEVIESWKILHDWDKKNPDVGHIDETGDFPYESSSLLNDFIYWCSYKKKLRKNKLPLRAIKALLSALILDQVSSLDSESADEILLKFGQFEIDFEK